MKFPRWFFSVVLAFEFILALLQLLDAFHVWYFPLINGYAYSLRFDLGFSLVPVLLPVSSIVLVLLLKEQKIREIFLSFSISLGLLIFSGLEASVSVLSIMLVALALLRFRSFEVCAFWILVLLTGFEGIALLHWILLPFGMVSPLVWFADLELSLFYVVAPVAPLIAAAIICMWFLRSLIGYVGIDRFLGSWLNLDSEPGDGKINIHPRALLALALIFSVVGALYPYSPKINPGSVPVGVDVHWYVEWVAEVEQNPSFAFTVAGGSRPVMILLIYGIEQFFGLSLPDVVKYLPTFLNPLLALSVYFLVSQSSEDLEWAALASLFTALGFTTTVGMYSYFLANILGLILLFLAFGFLFNALRTGSKVSLVSSFVLGSIVIFTHPWTFIQYYAATALFLGYKYFGEKRHDGCSTVLTYLGVLGLVDLLKGVVIGGLEGLGSIASAIPRLIDVAEFWSNNVFIFKLKYGGLLSNIVLLGLAALGAYTLKSRDDFKLFLISLLVTSSFFYFLTYEEVISRLLYNIPLGMFAATGLLLLSRNNVLRGEIRIALLLFIKIYMIVYLLRSVANLL